MMPLVANVIAMTTERSADIQKNLDLLYEQLAGKEKALVLAPQEERVRIKQQIRDLRRNGGNFSQGLMKLDRFLVSNS